MNQKILNLIVEGMHCGSCINRLSTLLSNLGAKDVDIDIAKKFVRIRFEGDNAFADVLIDAIEEVGYTTKKLSLMDSDYHLLDQ